MPHSRERQVYRVRQLPLHLQNSDDTARFLALIAPVLGTFDNIRVFSLAQEKHNTKTATVAFKTIPSKFDNDGQQWTLPAEVFCGRNIIVDTHFRGFTVLNEPRYSPHSADCIAISGLASHPFGSWKHRECGSDFMWLRDRLPQDVPRLRSVIYGYDTKLFKSHSFQDLDDIAWSFIASLKELRRSLPPARALFFLAHSLGGIVLKQALVLLAHSAHDEDKMILESITGLVFFGVPHRGMKISHFLAMVAKQPNEDLISKTLSPESNLLPVLHEKFSDVTLGITKNIRFVYETAESQLTEETPTGTWVRSETSYAVLVSKDSAVPLETPPHHAIAVNEDHSNMVKFGEDDPVYNVIKSFLFDLNQTRDGLRSGPSASINSLASQTSPLVIQDPEMKFTVESNSSVSTQKSVRACSTIPFLQDPVFVGREDILAQLESEFADPKSQHWASLYGLGGIGKSQIAIEHAYRQNKRFPQTSTFWVHASSRARFEQSFARIAVKAKISGCGDGKVDILQAVSNWLVNEENGPWLLVLDNADDAKVLLDPQISETGTGAMSAQRHLLEYLPRVQHGAVLITTRDRGCALTVTGYRGTPIEVLSMGLDESVELLRVSLPEVHQEEASELVQELENLPLAISQAGAYIKEVPRVTIQKYLAMFRRSNEDQVALLNKNKMDLRRDQEMPNAVITSWELSCNQIREQSPGSADLLSLMSYLNRQAIPQFLVQGDTDEISFEEDINPLLSFSLIRAEIQKESFEIHRLVQTAMQHWLCNEGYGQFWKERAIERVAYRFQSLGRQNQHWPIYDVLMSHADEVILYTASSKESEVNCAEILVDTAWYLIERKGHAGFAEQRSMQALQIQRRHFDEDSDEIFVSSQILASAQRSLGKFEEAVDLHENLLKRMLKQGGTEDEASLTSMHNLALAYIDLAQFEKAEDLLKRVVAISERLWGPENRNFLSSGIALASVYLNMGKYQEAERLSSRIVEIHIKCHGLEDADTLISIDGLSDAYMRQYKFEEAENLIVQAIPFFTKVFGSTHWRSLEARTALADIYYRQDKLDEAREICLSYYDTARELYGRTDITTIGLNNILGLVYRDQGKLVDALRLFKDSVEASSESFGADYPDTLVYMGNLARCYHDMGDKNLAIRLMAEVLEGQRKVLPADHPDITYSTGYLAYWKSEGRESDEWESEEEGSAEEGSETGEEGSEEDETGENDSMGVQRADVQISSAATLEARS